MKIKIVVLTIFLFTILGEKLNAQGFHFSKYEPFASGINSAFTGFIPNDDDLRISSIYRNQWGSVLGSEAYKTFSFSLEMRNKFSKPNRNSNNTLFESISWGIGLSFFHDESGTLSVKDNIENKKYPLNRNQILFSSSVIVPLQNRIEKKTLLHLGFRLGGHFNRIKTKHLSFDEQFDGHGGFNPTIIGEFSDMEDLNSQMMDLGLGVLLSHFNKKFGGFWIGGAIDHIIVPVKYEYLESDNPPKLSRRFSLDGKLSYNIRKNKEKPIGINFRPTFLHQGTLQEIVLRGEFFFQNFNHNNFTLTVGGGIRSTRTETGRNQDAALATLTIYLQKFSMGFNYDINTSSLREVSNSYGALEFSMIYYWKKKKRSGCPDKDTVHAIFF